MATAWTWDRALRAALVLPLRLLLLVLLVLLRLPYLLRRTPGVGRPVVLSSALFLVLSPFLLSVIFAVSNPRTSNNAVSKLEEMKMKVAHLESKLEETTQALSSQTLYFEDRMKLVGEMERQAEFLENELFGTKDFEFTKYNEVIDQLYDMRDTVGRMSLKNIADYNTWLMDICKWTNDESVCTYDSLTLTDFSRAGNDDGESEEENDGDYMYDNDISSNDDEDDVLFDDDGGENEEDDEVYMYDNDISSNDDDAEAAKENDEYKFDEDIFSDVEDGDYDIDDDEDDVLFDDDGGENEEDDEVYMNDNDISSNDNDAEAAKENDEYKFDEDIFSDVEDGDYDIDDDYFSFDDETKGDNDDDYKSNDVAYDDVFLEEDTKNDVFLDDDDGAWFP